MSDTACIILGDIRVETDGGVRCAHWPTEYITLHNSALNLDAPCEVGRVPGDP